MTDEEISIIRKELSDKKSIDRNYTVKLKDKEGKVYALVAKTVFVRRKNIQTNPSHSVDQRAV